MNVLQTILSFLKMSDSLFSKSSIKIRLSKYAAERQMRKRRSAFSHSLAACC